MNASDILQLETHSWDCNSGSMPKTDKSLKHLELNGCTFQSSAAGSCNNDLHCRHWPSKWLSFFFILPKVSCFFASTKSAETKQVYSWTDRREPAQAISFPGLPRPRQVPILRLQCISEICLQPEESKQFQMNADENAVHTSFSIGVQSQVPKVARRCHGIHKYCGMLPWNADSEGRTLEPRLRTSDQQHAHAGAFNLTLHPLSLSILSSHIGVHLIERILRI